MNMTVDFNLSTYAGILVGARNYFMDLEDEYGNKLRSNTLAIYIPFVVLNMTTYTELGEEEEGMS
jgi:hypothetical protein